MKVQATHEVRRTWQWTGPALALIAPAGDCQRYPYSRKSCVAREEKSFFEASSGHTYLEVSDAGL
jgi:hypothetical protein